MSGGTLIISRNLLFDFWGLTSIVTLQSKKTFDVAVYGPGIPMLNHKIDERLPVDQYWDFIAIYQAILSDYLS